MKAFTESARKRFDAAGLILPFAEKLPELVDGVWLMVDGNPIVISTLNPQLSTFPADERSATGILTPDVASLPPSRIARWHGGSL